MHKIFGYECRRLLLNKFFFGILLIILFTAGRCCREELFWESPAPRPFPHGASATISAGCFPFMDRCAVFPDFLYILPGAAHSRAHRRRAGSAPAVRADPVRRRLPGSLSPGAGLPGGSRRVLRLLFRMVRLERSGPPRSDHAGSAADLRSGKRLVSRTDRSPSDLCLDACPFLCAVLPLPEATGMLSGSFFTGVSACLGNDRPGIFPSAVRPLLSADSCGCRHRLSAPSGAAVGKKPSLVHIDTIELFIT